MPRAASIVHKEETGVATLTLNRPEVKNAINDELLDALEAALLAIDASDQVRSVIITGGEKAFCAGADIRRLRDLDGPLEAHRFCTRIQKAIDLLETIHQPTIAAISGVAVGGGCEIALACDLRIAAESALLGQPEINLGIVPGAGGTQRLPRLIGLTAAKELLFTGRTVSADEALGLGLVNRVVPDEDLMREARRLAETIASKPPVAVTMTKLCLRHGLQMPLAEALSYEARCFEFLFSTDDHREGVAAFLEKRPASFKGK